MAAQKLRLGVSACGYASSPNREGLFGPGLTDFNEVAVGITDVGANFVWELDGIGEEACAASRPFVVHAVDIGDADVQKRAGRVGVGRCGEGDGRLVCRGTAADIEDHPAVGQLEDDGVAVANNLGAEGVICGPSSDPA